MMRVELDAIVFDAGTQVRVAINESVVAQYAERMSEGDVFPPVVLFHDGNHYYMADGFHRALAAKRNNWREVDAEVKPGTKTDALWCALGANRTHAWAMTFADKKHAIALALQTWPGRSVRQIAEQIGVNFKYASEVKQQMCATTHLPDRVTGKDGKSYPASRRERPERAKPDGRALDRSPAAKQQRVAQMRTMAAEGHTSRQIASVLGLSEEGCRETLRRQSIDVPADRAVGKTRRQDSARIVEAMVADAENLTADVNLIDFNTLHDRELIARWLTSLQNSRNRLMTFIRRLQEIQKHGEAA